MTQLTPELALMAIRQGLLDDNLEQVLDEARARRDLVAARKAVHLEAGDEFYIVNISPKKLDGERVRFVKHDGQWLVCRLVSPFPPRGYSREQVIKLRHSHVGTVVKGGI